MDSQTPALRVKPEMLAEPPPLKDSVRNAPKELPEMPAEPPPPPRDSQTPALKEPPEMPAEPPPPPRDSQTPALLEPLVTLAEPPPPRDSQKNAGKSKSRNVNATRRLKRVARK